ncbi:RING finger protein nhl-1-like [Galleria mellonella]|uniref:RING finger protein nhl-1-like n=1 Tax=Galleria mellonella TaxID=7137 RepID=A0A6J1X1D7_GALME|nr:RING finger protein nhl-1-like [Galleria mellonella]
MAEKVKRKSSFFNLKIWNNQKSVDDSASKISTTPIDSTPQVQFRNPAPNLGYRGARSSDLRASRPVSYGGIKDLVQCPLCLETLHNAKMLPCQHTLCMACLGIYIADATTIECPVCRTKIQITGPNFVQELPSNLYIDSLLQLVGLKSKTSQKSETPPQTPAFSTATYQSVDLFAAGVRCSHCQTMCDNSDTINCQHCKMNFCHVCWSNHLDDMQTQVGSILKQLDSASNRLRHKIEHFKDRCEHLMTQIETTASEKINAIIESKRKLLKEVSELQKSGDLSALALNTSLEDAKTVATQVMASKEIGNDMKRVSTFMNLHQNALQILVDVSKWDTEHFVFDKENFRIEKDNETPLDAESDDPVQNGIKQNNPLENDNSLSMHYRCRSFVPHYVWRKTTRPCGIGIGPWNGHLYICDMDSHSVLVVERSQAKIVTRLVYNEMLCPVQIAFMKSLGEIYVSDKWKHCVHVFSKDGEYLRSLGQKGSRDGLFRSPEGIATDNANLHIYVVDTGNDRVQIIQPDGQFVDQIGVTTKQQVSPTVAWEVTTVISTEFNAPTDVAVTSDRIIILDSGNRRVKVYNKQDKSKIYEFGSIGQRKGQFRQPEVLAVDPMGFILVGDSGNCRVQVFKPNGAVVRVFGGYGTELGKFGWISGIYVTKQLDIIISDSRNHNVNFF